FCVLVSKLISPAVNSFQCFSTSSCKSSCHLSIFATSSGLSMIASKPFYFACTQSIHAPSGLVYRQTPPSAVSMKANSSEIRLYSWNRLVMSKPEPLASPINSPWWIISPCITPTLSLIVGVLRAEGLDGCLDDCHSVIRREPVHTLVVGDVPSPHPLGQVMAHLAASCYRTQVVDDVDPFSLKPFEEGGVVQHTLGGARASAHLSGARRHSGDREQGQ